MSFIEKARIFQDRCERGRNERKRLRDQLYREFLADPGRPLPGLRTLIYWRNAFILIAFNLLAMAPIKVVFFYLKISIGNPELIHAVSGGGFLSVGFFAAVVDYAIYKRFKEEKRYIIPW